MAIPKSFQARSPAGMSPKRVGGGNTPNRLVTAQKFNAMPSSCSGSKKKKKKESALALSRKNSTPAIERQPS